MMLRKNFMKRLSKSASDLSGCKKKTHSTSPEEEEKDVVPFSTPTNTASDDERDSQGGQHTRPSSAASTRSVPEFPASSSSAKVKKPLTGTLSRKARKLFKANKQQQPSEVGIRSVGGQIHSAYRGHQGFLGLLKEKFSGGKQQQAASPECPEGMVVDNPELIRRRIVTTENEIAEQISTAQHRRTSTPEIVRIRTTAATADDSVEAVGGEEGSDALKEGESNKGTQVIRHGSSENPKKSSDHDEPQVRPISGAEVVRYTTSAENKCPSKTTTNGGQMSHRQESLSSNAPSLESSSVTPAASATEPSAAAAELKCHSLYHLHVCLRNGRELVARDSGGTSDPYVKFYWRGKQVYKSKTIDKDLNPVWDESFILAIDDPFVPLELKVYDHDWAFRDDFMGEGRVTLSALNLDKLTDHVITLKEDNNTSEYLGQIVLGLRLVPKSDMATDSGIGSLVKASSSLTHVSAHMAAGSSSKDLGSAETGSKLGGLLKRSAWSATVNIVLVEGKGLQAMDEEGTSDPYCKVRLGNDRYKTKVIFQTLEPKWLEQFDLSLIEDQPQELEITVWDKDQRSKDDFMGRCSVDLSKLERETTHQLWVDLIEGTGQLFMLLTISGLTNVTAPIADLDKYQEDQDVVERRIKSFRLRNTFKDLNTIGHLQVKIYCAKGLYAADLGGKSDPFVVLELDNTRLQTHTEYKTITPTWNRVLQMPINDIHSVLHISVYDEDRNHKYEFLGKTAFPLLNIESGRKRWFALRDKKLRVRAKGNNPQILLQFDLQWNSIRAAIRTLNPKEEKFMATVEKFKRQVFVNNVMRIKSIIMEFVDLAKFVESLFEWESPVKTILAFIIYTVTVYYCEPFWAPIFLLLIFMRYYFGSSSKHHHHHHPTSEDMDFIDDDDLENEDDGKDPAEKSEEKMTFKERLQAVQDVTAMVQNALGFVAHLAEGVKNTFNFSVPFLSWLAIIAMIAVSFVLYYINLRYLLIVWGINKFSKKLIRPNYVPNNEVLDFLSRVPDDEEIKDYREMKLLNETQNSPSHKGGQSSGSGSAAASTDKRKKK